MAQFARPTSDAQLGSWTPTPLWSKVEEGAPGDDVEVASEVVGNNTNTSDFQVNCSPVSDPQVSTGHTLRVRWRNGGEGGAGRTILCRLSLLAPSQVAQRDTAPSDSTNFITDEFTLSQAEADAISNYGAIAIQVLGRGTSGGPSRSLRVDFVELQVPDAAPGNPSGGASAEIQVPAQGTGFKHASGGADAVIEAAAEGQASKLAQGGAETTIEASAEGAGAKLTAGGAAAETQAAPEGAGTKRARSGAEATIQVAAEGAGQAGPAAPSGGAEAEVQVAAEGQGSKAAAGQGEADVEASAQGAGRKHASGGAEAGIEASAEGQASKSGRGAAEVLLSIAAQGLAYKLGLAGAETGLSIAAQGVGYKFGIGGAEVLILVLVETPEPAPLVPPFRATAVIMEAFEAHGSWSQAGQAQAHVAEPPPFLAGGKAYAAYTARGWLE